MVLETGCPVDVADIEEDEMVRISENLQDNPSKKMAVAENCLH